MQLRRIAPLTFVLALLAAFLIAQPAGSYPPEPPDEVTSRAHLAELTLADEGSDEGYSRDLFPHWIDQGNSCDTRELVLQRDGYDVAVGTDCYPTSGNWYSVYDEVTETDPSAIDIDHIVPLAEAWRSGASSWSTDQRQTFANDLTNPQLIAVTDNSNSSKSDQDPSEWRPSNTRVWCYYARDWIQVKYYYDLTADQSEVDALYGMLDYC